MRTRSVVGVVGLSFIAMAAMAGCTGGGGTQPAPRNADRAAADRPADAAPVIALAGASRQDEPRNSAGATTWVGAAAESDVVLAQGGESVVGVWVDVPSS